MIQTGTFWLTLLASVVVFWILPKRLRYGFLALASVAYLLTLAPLSVAALLVWSVAFYALAPLTVTARTRFRQLQSRAAKPRQAAEQSAAVGGSVSTILAAPPASTPQRPTRRWVLPCLVISILSYLACFKYIPPIIFAFWPAKGPATLVIPLGISYFTFKFIHYAVESSRGNIRNRSLPQFFAYIFLFPIFTAGPIERFDHFLAHQDQSLQLQSVVEGLMRIIFGLIKKMVIADLLLYPWISDLTGNTLLIKLAVLPAYKVWAIAIIWFLYGYLDFSAYSDLAIGASRLFGLRIMENFNFPIVARNIGEFWKRWHMSLAGWCQSYVYMPALGWLRNPYGAVYATFVVIGLWHGCSWTWLFWGLWHATGIAVFQLWSQYKRARKWQFLDKVPGLALVGIAATFLFASAGEMLVFDDIGLHGTFRLMAKLLSLNVP